MFGQFERAAETWLLVAVALSVFALTALFLAVLAVAGNRRMSGREVGPRLTAALCAIGGATLGVMALFAPDAAIAAPLAIVLVALVAGSIRAGRHVQAGWLLTGSGIPIALAWLLVLATSVGNAEIPDLDPAPLAPDLYGWLGTGLALAIAGLALVWRGNPAPPSPSMAAPAGRPGSRSIGSIAAAIREPGMIGPFGLPEVAMLAALVFVWLTVPFLIPPDAHFVVPIGLPSLISAILGAEAYVRAMPPRSRRAFEAFSWLGEWELARARGATGRSVPGTPAEARRWLAERPERVDRLDEAALRVEILLLADQIDEAAALIERMEPRATTPWERFEITALRDLVRWRAGGEGDVPAMEAATDAILPRDSDDRLRAEVTVAIARVRRRMADGRSTPGDAAEPLLEVRTRLGDRANGQVGRALRPRLIPVLLAVNVLFGLVSLGLSALGGTVPG
jgi:hypothetical protein